MRILLSDAIISSYSLSIDPDEPPTETINVNYSRIAVKYYPQNSSGVAQASVVFNWDCEKVNEWSPAPRL
jgi:type VI protein secretion system component Hcp